MKAATLVFALIAGLCMPAAAQTFINLDFDQTTLPDPLPVPSFFDWAEGAPGWGHSIGENTDHLSYPSTHLGFSQTYALVPPAFSPFGAASGDFALAMRSGFFFEHEPRGDIVTAFVSQTGMVPGIAQTVSLLAAGSGFYLQLDSTIVPLVPVDLDPTSPTYFEDLLTYAGEWTGDVSAFAGQVVELKIYHADAPFRELTIDEIRFLPIPEPSTTALIGAGVLVLLLVARQRR